jgi:hypothetical protein
MGIYWCFANVRMSKFAGMQMTNLNNFNNILWVYMGVFK